MSLTFFRRYLIGLVIIQGFSALFAIFFMQPKGFIMLLILLSVIVTIGGSVCVYRRYKKLMQPRFKLCKQKTSL